MRLTKEVMAIGMSKELARELADVNSDLTNRPLEAGEVLYTLHNIPMPVVLLARGFLSVVYVVHAADKLVMVTKMKMLDNHPFPSGFEDFLNG
jgi:hypothetical protein